MASMKILNSKWFLVQKNSLLKVKHIRNEGKFNLKRRASNLSAYVSLPYSYAFGRSDKELTYCSIGQKLKQNATKRGNYTAMMSFEENISKTLAEVDKDVDRLAKGLITELGVKRGDIVGVWSSNCYSWVVIQHAVIRIGAMLCTVNPAYKNLELDFLLRRGQLKTIFLPGIGSRQNVVNNYHDVLTQVLKESKNNDQKNQDKIILENIIFIDGERKSSDETLKDKRIFYYEDLMKSDGIIDSKITDQVDPDDGAVIMFTSGTTGKPKGALQSNFTLLNNVVLSAYRYNDEFISDTTQIKLCTPLPMFHTFAGTLGAIAMSCVPIGIVLTGIKYNVKHIVESISKYNCTHLMATPTIMIDILDFVEKNSIKLPSLNGALLGGAPVPIDVALRIEKIIPSCYDVRIGYGATEFGPCSTANSFDYTLEQRTQTVGTPLDFVEIKIVNPHTGNVVQIGEKGELLARGHTVMKQYWRDIEKTNESFDKNRWYKSGDLAVMDEEGFIKIVGRTKEMIIRGGENIYPREIEDTLHLHPEIFDAYVTGVPDERTGEEVCAWIKLNDKDAKITAEDIKEFCKDKITYFKIPRYILFVDEFPLTPTGKVKKNVMREETCKILGLKELK